MTDTNKYNNAFLFIEHMNVAKYPLKLHKNSKLLKIWRIIDNNIREWALKRTKEMFYKE